MSYGFTVWLTGYYAPAKLPDLGMLQRLGAQFKSNPNCWQYASFEVETLDDIMPGDWLRLLHWYSNTEGATINAHHYGKETTIEPFGWLIMEHLKSLDLI